MLMIQSMISGLSRAEPELLPSQIVGLVNEAVYDNADCCEAARVMSVHPGTRASREAICCSRGRAAKTPHRAAKEVQWSQQFGTQGVYDRARGVANDAAGNVIVTGSTTGVLGSASQGESDIYLMELSGEGEQLWVRQFGTDADDAGSRVVVDHNGDIVLLGWTRGELGDESFGGHDMIVAKYAADGDIRWLRQLGTAEQERGHDVVVDESNGVYVSGTGDLGGSGSEDADVFVCKIDPDGELLWNLSYGAEGDYVGLALALDEQGGILVGGYMREEPVDPTAPETAFLARLL